MQHDQGIFANRWSESVPAGRCHRACSCRWRRATGGGGTVDWGLEWCYRLCYWLLVILQVSNIAVGHFESLWSFEDMDRTSAIKMIDVADRQLIWWRIQWSKNLFRGSIFVQPMMSGRGKCQPCSLAWAERVELWSSVLGMTTGSSIVIICQDV